MDDMPFDCFRERLFRRFGRCRYDVIVDIGFYGKGHGQSDQCNHVRLRQCGRPKRASFRNPSGCARAGKQIGGPDVMPAVKARPPGGLRAPLTTFGGAGRDIYPARQSRPSRHAGGVK
jgi:hypothetical protein